MCISFIHLFTSCVCNMFHCCKNIVYQKEHVQKKMKEHCSNRLNVFERSRLSKGELVFPKLSGKSFQNVSSFFINALSEVETIDISSIKNILNFAQTYFSLGIYPDQKIVSKIVSLIFKFPVFTPQFTTLYRYLPNDNWLYNSLVFSLTHHPDVIKASIQNDDPVWIGFLEKIRKDFESKKGELDKEYLDRDIFLIEVFVFYWPSESNNTKLLTLAKEFVDFCASTRSKTSLELLFLMIQIFHDDFQSHDYINLIPVGEKYSFGNSEELLKHFDVSTGKYIINFD